jgi:hypothetical protein
VDEVPEDGIGGKAGIEEVAPAEAEVPVEEGEVPSGGIGGKAGIVPDPGGSDAEADAETEAWESDAGGKGGRS